MEIHCAYQELIQIHKLQPHPKNPHVHSPEQIDRLASIIDYQGIRHPIIVSSRSGFIVAGHGRLAALKKLNVAEVPIDYQEFENEAQEYAFVVSDNAIGKDEWAALDFSQINKDLQELGGELDLEFLGLKNFGNIEPKETELPELAVGDPAFQQRTFILSNEQIDILDEAIEKAKNEDGCEDEINKNKNGNALSLMAKRYVYG